MEFFEDGEELFSTWKPDIQYQGWNSILHGGIQGTLIDEIASWYVFVKLKTFGVTSQFEVRLKKPVDISLGDISLRAVLSEMKRNIAIIKVSLFDGNNILCAEGTVHCYTFPPGKQIGDIFYPGYEKFIKD